jgi:alpha-tubulin suppressor-like RCC1 family protein
MVHWHPDHDVPLPVPGVFASDLAAASWTCAVVRGGRFACWGNGGDGTLGDGMVATSHQDPSPPSSLANISAIASGGDHACALLGDGTVACWGDNDEGQIGTGPMTREPTPQTVPIAPGPIADVATGNRVSYAIANGTIYAFGHNGYGELGDATSREADQAQALVLPAMEEVSAGDGHACSVGGGALYCWGDNAHGEQATGVFARAGAGEGRAALSRRSTTMHEGWKCVTHRPYVGQLGRPDQNLHRHAVSSRDRSAVDWPGS